MFLIYAPTQTEFQYESVLRKAIAAMCIQCGFGKIGEDTLHTILQEVLIEIKNICTMTRLLTEAAGRSKFTPHDLCLAIESTGTRCEELDAQLQEFKKAAYLVVAPPARRKHFHPEGTRTFQVLNAEQPEDLPSWLPPYPPPHTYKKTMIQAQPDISYKCWRTQKCELERNAGKSLTNFMLKTHKKLCLFRGYEERTRERVRIKLLERELWQQSQREERMDVDGDENNNEVPPEAPEEPNFDLPETESIMMANRVPGWIQLLEPREEAMPYLSALGVGEEDADEEAEMQKNQMLAKSILKIWINGSEADRIGREDVVDSLEELI
ncbi:hypothetical protein L596_008805 [Steinernema carpocapsae]|uniref:Transcription initiation factor TFIID subunit 8 n=1 Tax=Steinernema carpocapsae TaxID=34508 RepID=A0A4U5PED1_STECR|nr:hypothetical protein L596_008805 [Steinernema carpocapsae]